MPRVIASTNVYAGVAGTLRYLRRRKGLHAAVVGRQLGIAGTTLTRYERAEMRIPLWALAKLLRYYGASLTLRSPESTAKLMPVVLNVEPVLKTGEIAPDKLPGRHKPELALAQLEEQS